MTKIIFRNITEGIEQYPYDSQPITVYLYGDKYIRVEEPLDELQNLHGLIIIRDSESWKINLLDNTANHDVVDDELASMAVPLIPQAAGDERFEGLCYGKEISFFKDAPSVSMQSLNGITARRFSMIKDGLKFELFCKIEPERPYILQISEYGNVLVKYSFDEYTSDLPVDLKLFEVPSNVKIRSTELYAHPNDISQQQQQNIQYEQVVNELSDFTTYYYLNPQPRRAGVILRNLLNSPVFTDVGPDDSHSLNTAAYFFSRIAQLELSIIDDYIAIFEDGTYEQRCYMLKVLQVCGNQKVIDFFQTGLKQNKFTREKERIDYALQQGIPIGFNPLTNPVREGGDLDFLWMEFMATGEKEPVLKVIETLKDYDSHDRSLFIIARVAEWSLDSFCKQHEKVMRICKDQIPRLEGIVRERLETVVNDIEIEKFPESIPDSKMIKSVIRQLTPNVGSNTVYSAPVTYYRLGGKFWRVDKNNSIRTVVIEPHMWIFSTEINSGTHVTSPYDRNYFYPFIENKSDEIILRGLQLGTELRFMKAKKAKSEPVQRDDEKCVVYTVNAENVQVELLCRQQGEKDVPWKLKVTEENRLLFSCVYDEYNSDLKPDLSLFEIPSDVLFSEDTVNLEEDSETAPPRGSSPGLSPFIKDRLPEELKE
jgi:hypothetical protein